MDALLAGPNNLFLKARNQLSWFRIMLPSPSHIIWEGSRSGAGWYNSNLPLIISLGLTRVLPSAQVREFATYFLFIKHFLQTHKYTPKHEYPTFSSTSPFLKHTDQLFCKVTRIFHCQLYSFKFQESDWAYVRENIA